ncbi:hypothetical protein DPMN_076959 [Dreissena polymorpha]|uniref:Uncharacterized protein n=1 Tax=Dreissena polymorpha TaxID=45954 RepID=A0A9D3YL21_DREPO|nr:hypothetical protein DPMN_076959 [Dreissena polymorpha]
MARGKNRGCQGSVGELMARGRKRGYPEIVMELIARGKKRGYQGSVRREGERQGTRE